MCLMPHKDQRIGGKGQFLNPLSFEIFNVFQEAVCFCSNDGLKVTVEIAKCVQASAFIQLDIFQVSDSRVTVD